MFVGVEWASDQEPSAPVVVVIFAIARETVAPDRPFPVPESLTVPERAIV